MLGKPVWARSFGLALIVLVGCARTVPQDSKTGADGKIKGARELQLENGEAKATGIVTYPGGDRVDWKMITLPENKKGKLEIRLQWSTPRPGLQLAFDVLDEWNHEAGGSKRVSRKKARGAGKQKVATIENARGKYFIRIFAVGRGDAGKYKLTVLFEEGTGQLAFDPLKLVVNDPPKLADVPGVEQGCDEFTFDVKIPACKSVCPAAGAPAGWPACKGKCPSPPTVDEPACWASMPCPRGAPDERIKACKPKDWPPCPDLNNPDDANPNCRKKATPVMGRVIGKEVQGGDLIVKVGIGSDQGVKKDWVGAVLTGPSLTDRAFPGGDAKIIRIDKAVTVVKVRLTPDQIDQNKNIRFSPP
jgi:hypothetical protein